MVKKIILTLNKGFGQYTYVYIYCLKEAPNVVVRALVEAGADVNAANDQEDTPLSFAIVSWIYVFFYSMVSHKIHSDETNISNDEA